MNVKTISGKKVKLKIPSGTSSGKTFKLSRFGIDTQKGRGDHYVKVQIEVPDDLSLSQKRQFKSWARKAGLLKK